MLEVPSKKKVQKAGKKLAKDDTSIEEFNNAMATLRSKVKRLGFKAPIIAQRLKRTPSIIRKLQRFPSMSLASMQDIGGIRIVLSSIDDVYKLHDDIIKNSGRSKHEPLLPPYDYIKSKHEPLLPPYDYIKQPKQDGYRSLHQVFKYKSEQYSELNGLQIELQIRTKLQHAWATAVETLGIIERV